MVILCQQERTSQKSELSSAFNPFLSLFPCYLPHPILVNPIENHPLKLVNPRTAWDPRKLDSVQMLFCLSAIFTFQMDLK